MPFRPINDSQEGITSKRFATFRGTHTAYSAPDMPDPFGYVCDVDCDDEKLKLRPGRKKVDVGNTASVDTVFSVDLGGQKLLASIANGSLSLRPLTDFLSIAAVILSCLIAPRVTNGATLFTFPWNKPLSYYYLNSNFSNLNYDAIYSTNWITTQTIAQVSAFALTGTPVIVEGSSNYCNRVDAHNIRIGVKTNYAGSGGSDTNAWLGDSRPRTADLDFGGNSLLDTHSITAASGVGGHIFILSAALNSSFYLDDNGYVQLVCGDGMNSGTIKIYPDHINWGVYANSFAGGATSAVYYAQSTNYYDVANRVLYLGTNLFGGGSGGAGITNVANNGVAGVVSNGVANLFITGLTTNQKFLADLALHYVMSITNGLVISIYPDTAVSELDAILMVVGGGGGGGDFGGGGAGAYIYSNSFSITSGTYVVTVGDGGAGGSAGNRGGNGTTSIFSTVSAIGGGGGGAFNTATPTGLNGGSGGGGGTDSDAPDTGRDTGRAGGTGTAGQGTDGGWGVTGATAGGGGGGSSVTGTWATVNTGGTGGNGTQNSILGSNVIFAAGGGGGGYVTKGTGGTGGGGNGAQETGAISATAGAGSTGSGGGGGYVGSGGRIGAAGGSGVVVLSYEISAGTATGGLITTNGTRRVHRFTTGGNFFY